MASTEEVVKALMEYLVDPRLPLKSSSCHVAPSLSQQHSVAKQLHAVVLLYNYYQRKQNPQAQYLDFESFCKLLVTVKPALVSYMKFMNQSDPLDSKDMTNDLSVAEKAIQDACNISCGLDASKDVPSINKWIISKVSVFLLDSKKEACWLLYSSVTDGVWSLLERSLELPTAEMEGATEGKHLNKKRRTSMKPVRVDQKDDDSGFQQLAFLAVKDATGISRSDLVVLEKHVVYSLSKEKTASWFYIMQCTQPINQDIQIPVKEIFESSLQGPLVKRSSGSWSTTEVVEYFHLLPYASIMSAFIQREVSNSLDGSNTRSCKDTLDNFEKEISERKISLFDQKLGDLDIKSSIGSDNARSVFVSYNNDMYDRYANPAGDLKDLEKENGVQHETVSSYGSFSGEAKEGSGSEGSQSIEEKIEKVEVKMLDESSEALIGTKSDDIDLGSSKAKNSDGRREKVSHSAVGQEATSVDGPQRIRKTEDAGIDSASRSKGIVDFSGNKLAGVDLESLNDIRNDVHHENTRDYEESTGKELYAVINSPKTPEEKGDELVKSTKSCEINDFSGMELAGAHLEPLEVHVNDDYQRMDIDSCSKNGNNCKNHSPITKVYHHQKKRTRESGGQIIESGVICRAERTDEGKAGKACGPNRNGIPAVHTAVVPYKHESTDIGDLQTVLASKEKVLAQSTLRVLLHKREKLCHQRRKLEDDIALFDKSIQRILDGGKDNLALKLETLLSFCDEMCLKDRAAIQEEDHQPDKELDLLQPMYGRKLSKAVRTSRCACQDLDHICCMNNWMFPSYSVSATDGGFHAGVTVKGVDFIYSCESALRSSPSEARESAAFEMITKLQTMVDYTH